MTFQYDPWAGQTAHYSIRTDSLQRIAHLTVNQLIAKVSECSWELINAFIPLRGRRKKCFELLFFSMKNVLEKST